MSYKPAKKIKRDLGKDLFNTYYKFCNIRNPYDIAVSFYCWGETKKCHHIIPSSSKTTDPSLKNKFNKWLKHEKTQKLLYSNIKIWSI